MLKQELNAGEATYSEDVGYVGGISDSSILESHSLDDNIYLLSIDYAKEIFYAINSNNLKIEKNDFVIVPTKYGVDIARVCSKVKEGGQKLLADTSVIKRLATEEDIDRMQDDKDLEKEAQVIFREKVKDNNLNMKFIACHLLLEEPKIIFFFSADGRVDFRLLVRDLVSIFKMRVELRQVSGREESRFIGGMAPCGRAFCCNSVSNNKVESVSIKMAKEQGLSLNSNRISGHCGRLLCCLAYEHQYYTEINRLLPAEGVRIDYDGNTFKVIDGNRVTGMVSLVNDEGHTISIPLSRIKKTNNVWQII